MGSRILREGYPEGIHRESSRDAFLEQMFTYIVTAGCECTRDVLMISNSRLRVYSRRFDESSSRTRHNVYTVTASRECIRDAFQYKRL